MISGALLLGTNSGLKRIFAKVLRLGIALIFWSVVYALIIGNYDKNLLSFLGTVLDGFGHCWFLYMIAGLYLIIPILDRMIDSEKVTNYFLLLSLLFAFIVPRLGTIYPAITGRSFGILNDKIEEMYLYLPLGYSGYFVLGYLLHKKRVSSKFKRAVVILAGLGFAFVFFIHLFKKGDNVFRQMFPMGYITPVVLIESVAVFFVCKKLFEKVHISSEKIKKALCLVSKWTFGVYLVHILVQNFFLNILNLTNYIGTSIASMLLSSLIVFLVSLGISAALNSIPVIKKYIV